MSVNVDALKNIFTGEIILPEHEAYKTEKNALFVEGAPMVVLKPKTSEDVAAAITFAKDQNLVVSIRSGGHSGAGFSTNTGGLVIDLAHLNAVEIVDETTHLVRIGSGARWGNVAKTLGDHGLAISSGDTLSVGVGGLTTGGGIGWIVRKWGLAIDSLVSAEVVTADSKIVTASKDDNPDLFWAIRGGGGNFGVVTSFEFEAHQIGQVYSGTIFFTLDNLSQLITGLRDYMRTADESLTTILNIIPAFAGNPPGAMLTCCYVSDDEEAAKKVIEPLKKLGTITNESLKIKPYHEVLEEAHPPAGVKIVAHNIFAKDLSDDLIAAMVKAKTENPGMIIQLRMLGGALTKVGKDETAFPHRDAEVLIVCPTFIPPQMSEADVVKALQPWQTIAPFGMGAYSGFLSENTGDEVSQIYPEETLARLAKIKKQYDPENLFNQNYNIKPAN